MEADDDRDVGHVVVQADDADDADDHGGDSQEGRHVEVVVVKDEDISYRVAIEGALDAARAPCENRGGISRAAMDGKEVAIERTRKLPRKPLIRFTPVLSIEPILLQENPQQRTKRTGQPPSQGADANLAIVFTSKNAVLAAKEQLHTAYRHHLNGRIPPFSEAIPTSSDEEGNKTSADALAEHIFAHVATFCVGKKTAAIVESTFPTKVRHFAKKASDLATHIIKTALIEHVLFFCGNPHRPELPTMLREAKIGCDEVVCYESLMNEAVVQSLARKILEHTRGLLIVCLFSPSTASALIRALQLPTQDQADGDVVSAKVQAIFVAIGPTTGAPLEAAGLQTIVCASPSADDMAANVRKVVNSESTRKSNPPSPA